MTILVAFAAGLAIIGGQACGLGKTDSYNTISAADLTSLVDTQSDQEKRGLAQNEAQRKGMVTQLKQMFSLAQAAQAEGLDKTETFKQQITILTDYLVIQEAQKKQTEIKYTEDEGKAYVAGHQKEFDADLKMFTEGQSEGPTPEQVEMMKAQWGEMKVRSTKARQSGIDKDPIVLLLLKFRRANLLADLYSKELTKKLKPSEDEMKKYLAEHPESDLEKIKQKAEQLLARVKGGEDFATIAKQFTEDGSRDQGGDLEWFTKGKMDPTFEQVAFALQKGQTSDLIKTRFGYHIIKLDDRRMAKPTPEPKSSSAEVPPVKPPVPAGPQEEIRARHIFLSTQEADKVEDVLVQKKVKRAMEDASLQYPVQAAADFTVNVAGLQKEGRRPDTNSGRIITPN